MLKRVLVTTALEETWPTHGEPILFLGEWCRLYSRKTIWEELNAEVVSYHWDDRNKLYQDYRYLDRLYEKLLTDLASKLNCIHGVSHSDRYWRILVGPWLGFFTQALFDRWFMLGVAIDRGDIDTCNVIERDELGMIPNDMAEFARNFVNDDWNEFLFGQLLTKDIFTRKLNIRHVKKRDVLQAEKKSKAFKHILKNCARALINNVNWLLTHSNDHFFLVSYLPLCSDLLLQLKLGQLPKRWRLPSLPIFKPSSSQRAWSLDPKNNKSCDVFEAVVRKLIPAHIPVAYLEGYAQLTKLARDLPWPKTPKSIFTSNCYEADDLFKVWAGEKVGSGVPLLIGQHGGHFGMSPFAFHEEHQIKIADQWLSWGWSDSKRANIKPIGNLKAFGRNLAHDPKGSALMVEMGMPRYSYHIYAAPISRQQLDYFDDQKRFLSHLPSEIRRKVVVRLYMQDYGWGNYQRWHDENLGVQIEDGTGKISSLIAKSRIYIATYNATTFLEAMTWNIPTLIFWNPKHWELNSEAKPYLDMLEAVGIFHQTPENAAKQMVAVWDSVETWWFSQKVQDARHKFCNRYTRTPVEFLDEMKCLFQAL